MPRQRKACFGRGGGGGGSRDLCALVVRSLFGVRWAGLGAFFALNGAVGDLFFVQPLPLFFW